MAQQKLIVISFDAMIYEDIPFLQNKKAFSQLFKNGSMVKAVKSIYPSLTYPCHTTMLTGCWPDKHKVINNTYDVISEHPPYKFEHKNVCCTDLLDSCKKAGLTTASIGWPVSGNHPSVDYLLPECWPQGECDYDEMKELYLKLGTPVWLFDNIVSKYFHLRLEKSQPETSYFYAYISAEIIKNHRPDVLVVHPCVLDTFRHKKGVFSDLIKEGYDHCDKVLDIIVQATKEAGVFEDTNFVVTADHGQLNTTRTMHVNCLLAENGLIKTDANANVTDWAAWCFPMGGMSAYIRLNNPSDKGLHNFVHDLLVKKAAEGLWGFSQVFTREECQRMHLDGDFSFVIESDGYTSFGNKWYGKPVETAPFDTAGPIRGEHGFHPDKGPRPPFIACGPSFKKGVIIDDARLIDGAPTYARILGVSLTDADGKPLTGLLKSK